MTHQFQPLAFAAGEGVDRLAEAQVAEADFLEEFQARFGAASGGEVGEAGEELQGVIDGGFEEVGDAPVPGGEVLSAQWGRGGRGLNTGHWALGTEHFPRPLTAEFHFQNMLAIAPPVAVRAADEDVAEELHLDLLEARAPAAFALADAGVEAEGAGVEAALLRQFGGGEEFAEVFERADVNGGVGARGFAERGLIDEDDLGEVLPAGEGGRGAWGVGRVVFTFVGVGLVGDF